MTPSRQNIPTTSLATREVLFFLHIPRTAGTTLNHVLADNFKTEEILSAYDRRGLAAMERLAAEDLSRIRLIQGHMLIQDFTRLFAPIQAASDTAVRLAPFTFLRAPVARVISEYRFLKTWRGQHMYEVLNRDAIGLREYVTSRRKDLRWRGKNLMTRVLSGMDFGFDPTGADVDAAQAKAMDNLKKQFAFTGITERFDESILLLRRRFDFKFPFYVRRNSLSPTDTEEISHDILDLVLEHNQSDARLYAFANRLLDQSIADMNSEERQDVLHTQLSTLRFVNTRYQKLADLIAKSNGNAASPIQHPKDENLLGNQ